MGSDRNFNLNFSKVDEVCVSMREYLIDFAFIKEEWKHLEVVVHVFKELVACELFEDSSFFDEVFRFEFIEKKIVFVNNEGTVFRDELAFGRKSSSIQMLMLKLMWKLGFTSVHERAAFFLFRDTAK
mgnify:FL=1